MKKGRGLVDCEIFDEMAKVPGTHGILFGSVTNHRINPSTDRLCAEIHEDAWPEVKQMVRQWTKFKRRRTK